MNTAKFAKLCNTDKRTLFYYDEINLLKPNKILDNGYRDYELRQMVDMDNIKILQACGYTLFEIKDILNSKDKLEYIENGIKKLEEKIDNLTKVKSYLLNKKSILDEYLETPDIKIHDNSYISYDLVELEGPHFFSYINDGFDNRSLFDFNKRKIARLVLNKDGKYHKEGKAISGFIKGMSNKAINSDIIKDFFKGYDIEDEVLIVPVPRLLIDNDHFLAKVVAWIKK